MHAGDEIIEDDNVHYSSMDEDEDRASGDEDKDAGLDSEEFRIKHTNSRIPLQGRHWYNEGQL